MGCHDYYDVIKHPMDLSTMHQNFENGIYKTEDDFATDMRLMFQNCYQYNGPETHPIVAFCKGFENLFEDRFSKIKMQKEKSKVTIFDKIDQREKEIRHKIDETQTIIDHQQSILQDYKDELEDLIQQRTTEQNKLNEAQNPTEKKKSKKPEKKKEEKKPKEVKMPKKKKKVEQPVEIPQRPQSPLKSDSEEDDTVPSMTYDECTNLLNEINKLSDEQLPKIIEILEKFEPNLPKTDSGEIELEIGQLKPITQRSIEQFFKDLKKPGEMQF